MAKRRRKVVPDHQLDIVIPVYGRPDLLQKCLNSVNAQEGVKSRLTLVDDHGPDQGKLDRIYYSLNSDTRVIRNDQNLGFARTVNRGVDFGVSSLILILNTDVELKPGAIQAMVDEFENKEVGVVGPKLLFPDNTPYGPAGRIQHAGLAVNFRGQVVHVNIGWSADNPKVNERREMQAVTGACLMTRRAVWRETIKAYQESGDKTTGAFNDVYGRGTYEDVEYCFAARSFGHNVIYQPQAAGYHYVGGSSAAQKEGFPLQRNELIFRARCGGMLAWDEWRYL